MTKFKFCFKENGRKGEVIIGILMQENRIIKLLNKEER